MKNSVNKKGAFVATCSVLGTQLEKHLKLPKTSQNFPNILHKVYFLLNMPSFYGYWLLEAR